MGFAQNVEDDNTRSFLFGLIKLKRSSPYLKGYRWSKWLHAREFNTPVRMIPLEFKYGVGFNGKTSGELTNLSEESAVDDTEKIKYESDVEPITQGYKNIWGSSVELDMGLVNIPYYLVGTSWLNLLTGVTYRQSTLIYPAEVPYESWGDENANWGDLSYFSPKVTDYMITNHIQLQPYNSWFLNVRYSYGLSNAQLYSTDRETWEDAPTGSGTSSAYGVGFRYILDPGKANRFTAGIDFRYSYTKLTIDDPADLTPISTADLSNYGLYFTLSAFFGGERTSGDDGKDMYYRKDYYGARSNFEQFLLEQPTHANRHRAKDYLGKIYHKIPYLVMKEGKVLDDDNKTRKAIKKYQEALSLVRGDTVVTKLLTGRIEQIALQWMSAAEDMLKNGDYITAYSLVKEVAGFSEYGKRELPRFKSHVILGEGKQYQEALFIGKAMEKYAEALALNPDLIYDIKSLQYKAGIQMAKLATQANEFDEIQLAIQSLEYARELSGSIGPKNEKLLEELREKLASLDEYKSQLIIDHKMDSARHRQALARSQKLAIGQTIPKVQELLGEPHDKIVGDDGANPKEQLWIYFLKQKTLHLTFVDFALYRIEEI